MQDPDASGQTDQPATRGAAASAESGSKRRSRGYPRRKRSAIKSGIPAAKNILSSVRDVAFVAAIFLYFGGYEYHYLAFSNFNLSPDDVPIQSIFVFAYPVLGTYVVEFLLLALLGIGIAALLMWLARSKYLSSEWLAFSQAIAAFAFSVVVITFLYKWANDTATFDSLGAASSTPCRFVLKGTSARKYDVTFKTLNDQFKLNCLYETKETIYVIRLLQSHDGSRQYLYAVPKSDVELSVSYIVFGHPNEPLRTRLWPSPTPKP